MFRAYWALIRQLPLIKRDRTDLWRLDDLNLTWSDEYSMLWSTVKVPFSLN